MKRMFKKMSSKIDMEEILCNECDGEIKYIGKIKDSFPKKYQHRCNRCGNEYFLGDIYPSAINNREDKQDKALSKKEQLEKDKIEALEALMYGHIDIADISYLHLEGDYYYNKKIFLLINNFHRQIRIEEDKQYNGSGRSYSYTLSYPSWFSHENIEASGHSGTMDNNSVTIENGQCVLMTKWVNDYF